ncbi:holo-ACP synthase [Candidatus Omnitrophota bacterium]
MEIRTGIDIVNVARVQESIEKHGDAFLKKIFNKSEIVYCEGKASKFLSYAARFAAKEAFIKAIGGTQGIANFIDIEIVNQSSGKPRIVIDQEKQKALNISQISLSVSHEKDFAVAMVVLI